MSEARVQGKFLGSGFLGTTFVFLPKCAEGSCAVFGKGKGTRLTFKRNGANYSGTVQESQNCSAGGLSTPVQVKFSSRFRVVKADWIQDEWRATALKVSSRFDSPGAKKTITSGGWVRTVTCDPVHDKESGTSYLKGH